MGKHTLGAAALAVVIGLLTGTTPSEAQAAGCGAPGKLMQPTYPLYSPTNGEQIGTLQVYYSSRNGGTNTACVVHAGRTVGEGLQTEVSIARCNSYYGCASTETSDADRGHYRYHAGPASVAGTRRKCVNVSGTMEDRYSDGWTSVSVRELGCEASPQVRRSGRGPQKPEAKPGPKPSVNPSNPFKRLLERQAERRRQQQEREEREMP